MRQVRGCSVAHLLPELRNSQLPLASCTCTPRSSLTSCSRAAPPAFPGLCGRSKNAALGLGGVLALCIVTIIVLATGGDDTPSSPANYAVDPTPHRSVQGCTTDDAPPPSPTTADLSPADLSGCEISIVGAGPGGVYTAWRLAKDGVATTGVPAERVCIFERTERLGGRIFSVRGLGPYGDLVVESGAYRFSSDGATPLLTALIQAGVNAGAGIPWVPYDTSHNKIVTDANDPDSNAGYVTFIEVMLEEAMSLGVRYYPRHELVKVTEPISPKTLTARDWSKGLWAPRFELTFANGATTVTSKLVNNIMQQPLLQVLQRSSLSFMQPSAFLDPQAARSESENALYLAQPNTACKFYAYYENAWWRNTNDQYGSPLLVPAMEITGWGSGSYRSDPPDGMSMPLSGRYHDGHSRCRRGTQGRSCYGYLMMVYTSSRSGGENPCSFFEEYQVNSDPPVTMFTPDVSAAAPFASSCVKPQRRGCADGHRRLPSQARAQAGDRLPPQPERHAAAGCDQHPAHERRALPLEPQCKGFRRRLERLAPRRTRRPS